MQYKCFKSDLIAKERFQFLKIFFFWFYNVQTSLILTDDDDSNKDNKIYATHKKDMNIHKKPLETKWWWWDFIFIINAKIIA